MCGLQLHTYPSQHSCQILKDCSSPMLSSLATSTRGLKERFFSPTWRCEELKLGLFVLHAKYGVYHWAMEMKGRMTEEKTWCCAFNTRRIFKTIFSRFELLSSYTLFQHLCWIYISIDFVHYWFQFHTGNIFEKFCIDHFKQICARGIISESLKIRQTY